MATALTLIGGKIHGHGTVFFFIFPLSQVPPINLIYTAVCPRCSLNLLLKNIA